MKCLGLKSKVHSPGFGVWCLVLFFWVEGRGFETECFELDVRSQQFRDLGGTERAEVVVQQLQRS